MWRTMMVMVLSLSAFAVAAEQSKSFGDFKVHYNAFNSSSLTPEIAKQYGITRGANQGVVNIAIRNHAGGGDVATAAKVEGSVRNLLSQKVALKFKEIREGDAIYYIAGYRFDNQDTMIFELNVTPEGAAANELIFNQTLDVR